MGFSPKQPAITEAAEYVPHPSCLAVAFWIPGLVPVSKENRRDHWANVVRRERDYVAQLNEATRRVRVIRWEFPVVVTFRRVGMRILDDDNLSSAYKKLRDAVAKMLGVDDGDTERVRWAYTQETAKRANLGTMVTIRESPPRDFTAWPLTTSSNEAKKF